MIARWNTMRLLAGVLLLGLPTASHLLAQTDPSTYGKLDTSTYALIVRTRVADGKRDEFVSLIKARVKQSRIAQGVVDFRIFNVDGDQNDFLSFESFRSKAAFEAFKSSAESLAFLKKMAPLVGRPPMAIVLDDLP